MKNEYRTWSSTALGWPSIWAASSPAPIMQSTTTTSGAKSFASVRMSSLVKEPCNAGTTRSSPSSAGSSTASAGAGGQATGPLGSAGAGTPKASGPSASAAPSPSPSASKSPASVRIGADNKVNLSTDLLFKKNSATLTADAHSQLLDLINQVTKDHRRGSIKVVGFTDDSGSTPFNKKLSVARAQAVAAVLRQGLPGVKVYPSGEGELNPAFPNTSDENRAKNRRVQVSLPPMQAH